MAEHVDGVRRAERYVYQSLHWGFPCLPLLGAATLAGRQAPAQALGWTALSLVMMWCALVVLHTGLRRRGDLGPSRWDRWWLSSRPLPYTVGWLVSSAVLAATSPALLGETFLAEGGPMALAVISLIAGVLANAGFGVGRRRHTWLPFVLATVLVALAVGGAAFSHPPFPGMFIVAAVWAWTLLGLSVMLLNLLTTTQQLDRARRDSARLAVTGERVRFARDLHDVFGRTLSAVALKAELAAAQAEAGRPEAVAGMREVQTIATDALSEVRALVRGYRDVDLGAELQGARALLESAGIAVTTVSDTAELPGPVARTFAWVVREAATNVLRHSAATQARITLTGDAAGARLQVGNDRPEPGSGTAGSGLLGLAERLSEVGGTLEHNVRNGWFMLTAQVPADALDRLRVAERNTP